jgi:hypothetical protein
MTDWSTYTPGAHEIELYTGAYLNLETPDPSVITLDDIAHGLAYTCRYSGQCADYYSIAQHAVMCARYVLGVKGGTHQEAMAALHHDDAEAFLGDIVRPLKGLIQPQYGTLSDIMDVAVASAFGDLWPADALKVPVVKEADNWALFVEAYRLLPSQGKHWMSHDGWGLEDRPPELTGEDDHDLWKGYQSPRTAAESFKRMHRKLLRDYEEAT